MVHLRTVPDAWHGKVIAARLGCEGIVTQLEGNLSGPYPFGAVRVMVEADQAELAAALLLADEVEAAFASVPAGAPAATPVAGEHGPEYDWQAGTEPEEGPAPYALAAPAGLAASVRLRRAAALVVALAIAGAGVLAHFIS